MPPHVSILDVDGDPAEPIEVSLQAGEESAVTVLEIWNDRDGAFPGTTTAQNVVVSLLASVAGGPFRGYGVPLLDQLWTRFQITARLTLAGESTDGVTGTRAIGTNADAPVGDLPPQTGVRVELQVVAPAGSGGSATRIKLAIDGDRSSVALSPMVTLPSGGGVVPPDRVPLLRALVRGRMVAADDSDTVTLSAGHMVYDERTVTLQAEGVTFNLNDSAAAALLAGESYRVTLAENPAGVLVVTKGPKNVVDAYPAKAAADVFVANLTVESDDGVTVTVSQSSVLQTAVVYAGYAVRAGVGLTVIVSTGDGVTSNDHRQYAAHETSVDVAASTTNYVWRLHGGGMASSLTDVAPSIGANLLALALTDAVGVTAIVDQRRFIHRAVTEWTHELRYRGVLSQLATPALALDLGFLDDDAELEAVELDLSATDPSWTGGTLRVDVRAFAPGAAVPFPAGGAGVGGTSIFTADAQRPAIAWNAAALRVVTIDHVTRRLQRGARLVLDIIATVAAPAPEPQQLVAVRLRFRRYR